MEVGKKYHGVVKSLTSYGAFVDIGGVDGMVHVSELSWGRIHQPSEVVSVGDEIDVYVINFDREKRKISLGYKDPDANPWTMFTNRYSVGDTAEVKIVKLMSFGAFAEVLPGVDGLIHISQIADHKIAKPDDVLSVGQTVDVKIVSIDGDKHQIGLSIRALSEPAYEEAPAEAEAEPAGDEPIMYSTDNPESYKSFEGEDQQ
jgi:4-hydroxy-3-methylbut-2-enyl diphosphate reductase